MGGAENPQFYNEQFRSNQKQKNSPKLIREFL